MRADDEKGMPKIDPGDGAVRPPNWDPARKETENRKYPYPKPFWDDEDRGSTRLLAKHDIPLAIAEALDAIDKDVQNIAALGGGDGAADLSGYALLDGGNEFVGLQKVDPANPDAFAAVAVFRAVGDGTEYVDVFEVQTRPSKDGEMRSACYYRGRIDADEHVTNKGYVDNAIAEAVANVADLSEAKTYVDAQDAATLDAAKAYTDENAGSGGVSQEYVDNGDAAGLDAAKAYTDEVSADDRANGKTYVDNGDEATLAAAKAYADGVSADDRANGKTYVDDADEATLAAAKAYTDENAGSGGKEYRLETDANPDGTPEIQLVDNEDMFSGVQFVAGEGIQIASGPSQIVIAAQPPDRGNALMYRFKSVDGIDVGSRNGELCVNSDTASEVTYFSLAPRDIYGRDSKDVTGHDRLAIEVITMSGRPTGQASTYEITDDTSTNAFSVSHLWSTGSTEPFTYNTTVNVWTYSSTGSTRQDVPTNYIANDNEEKAGRDANNVVHGSITFNNDHPYDLDTFAFRTMKNGESSWVTFGTNDEYFNHVWALGPAHMVWRQYRDSENILDVSREGVKVQG